MMSSGVIVSNAGDTAQGGRSDESSHAVNSRLQEDESTHSYNSSDDLLMEVMKHQLAIMAKKHPKMISTGAHSRLWRVVSGRSSDCSLCSEPGGVVLMHCSGSDKCPYEYHIECAYQDGGLLLDDDGILSVFCSSHFKPLLFCSCKEKYDDSRPMIYCDECSDWFHHTCENLSIKDLNSLTADQYVCKSCKASLKQGKAISKATKDKNYEKECRSGYQQNATRAIRLLLELSSGLCPIIDEITSPIRSQFSVKEIKEALEVLSKSPFTQEGTDVDTESLVDRLGIQPLIDQWKLRLLDYISMYNDWYSSASELYSRSLTSLSDPEIAFLTQQLTVLDSSVRDLKEISKVAVSKLIGTPTDSNGFYVVLDCMDWMLEYLTTLHSDAKSESWMVKISNLLRLGSSKQKTLQGSGNGKNFFCSSFQAFFQDYLAVANQHSNSMKGWYTQAYKFLSQNLECNFQDLQQFLSDADGFPTRPPLYSELSELLQSCNQVEQRIEDSLNSEDTDRDLIQELMTKSNELGVALPSHDKFSVINAQLIFITAYEMSFPDVRKNPTVERLPTYIAENLQNEAKALIENSSKLPQSKKSILSECLDRKVIDAERVIADLLQETSVVVSTMSLSLPLLRNTSIEEDDRNLSLLRGLRLIAPEEEMLEFLKAWKAVHWDILHMVPIESSNTTTTTTAVKEISLSDAQSLIERIESLLENNKAITDEFDPSRSIKLDLNKHHSELVDHEVAAEKLWKLVSDSLLECERGSFVSREELSARLEAAENTRFIDNLSRDKAKSLLQAADNISDECSTALSDTQFGINSSSSSSSIGDDSDVPASSAIETLYQRCCCYPVSASLFERISNRRDICNVVRDSHTLLTQSSHQENDASETALLVSDRDITAIRDLNHRIWKMHEKAESNLLDAIESSMFLSVKDRALLLCWRKEVHYAWSHPCSIISAENIIAAGQKIGEAAMSSSEWTMIGDGRKKALDFFDACRRVNEEVHKLKASSADELVKMSSSSDISRTPYHLPVWTEQSQLVASELSKLMQIDMGLKIRNAHVSQQLKESIDLISLVNNAHARISAIHHVLDKAAMMTSKGNTTTEEQITHQPIMDLSAVTSLTNQLSLLSDREQHSSSSSTITPFFPLLSSLIVDIKRIYVEACRWNEQTATLVPQKATRYKLKSEANVITKQMLMERLKEPIAMAIHTPMHQKVYEVLRDADNFRTRLIQFLLSGDSYNTYLKAHDVYNYQSVDFQERLRADMSFLNEMKDVANLMIVELSEFKILGWVSSLYDWIVTVPYPGDDPLKSSITLEYAQKKLLESEPLILNVPTTMMDILSELGIVNLSSNQGSIGFKATTIPVLRMVAGEVREYLEEQVMQTEARQQRIFQLTQENARIGSKQAQELQSLYNEAMNLIVELSPVIRRLLERAIKPTTPGGDAPHHSSSSSRGPSVEVVEAEDDDDENEDYIAMDNDDKSGYWSPQDSPPIVNKKTASKRAKGPDGLPIRTTSSTATSATAVKKESVPSTVVRIKAGEEPPTTIGVPPSSGVPPSTAPGPPLKRMRSVSFRSCMNADCQSSAKRDSMYCSSDCAIINAPNLLTALLRYRRLLCLYGGKSMNILQVSDPNNLLQHVSKLDWSAFMIGANNLQMLTRSCSEVIVDQLTDASSSAAAALVDKKGSYIQSILKSLPPAAGPFIWRGDNDELAIHNSNIVASGAVPVPYNRGLLSVDDELRLKVRYKLEDLIARTFLRLKVPGATPQAAFLALDVEDELYCRYLTSSSAAAGGGGGSSTKTLNSKEYTKHYIMLLSNLKKSHNDQLLLKLISADLTIEELLSMSAQQLADATTQQKRQQERSNVLQDAYRGVSTQETIEMRNREVMSGAVEAWRTGELDSSLKRSINSSLGSSSSSNEASSSSSSVGVSSTSPGGIIDVGMTIEMMTESGSSKDQSESETSEAKTAASSHGGTTGLKKTPTSKRPLDIDAMSRFNIHSAHDFPPSIDTSSDLNEKNNSAKLSRLSETKADPSQSITMSKESPRNKPPPTLLQSILANQVSSKLAKEKSDSASSVTGGNMWSSAKLCKLISSAGSYDFSIVRPAHGGNNKSVVLKCQGLIADRNLQGIIATSCNIDGRVKLDEFVRITTKLMSLLKDDKAAHHKKLITPLKLTVVGSSIPGSEAALNYKKFIDEFGTDSRVGLSNLGCKTANSNPQLYVLPPSLTKSCLSVFSCFDGDTTTTSSSSGGSDHFLYGVLTSKDPGPAQYTKEGVVVMSSSSSGSSSSPSTAMKSSIPSVVSSSSVPSQGGAMKISSSTSSIGSGAAVSAIQPSGTKSTSPSATTIGTTAPTNAIAIASLAAAAPTIIPPPMRSGVAPTPSASSTTPAPPARPPVPPTKPTTTSMHPIAPPPKPTTQVSPSTHTQNKSISPSNPTATTTSAVTTSAVASSTTTASDDPIYRVAIFCAGRGVQAIRDLQAKAEARSVMPFIFDGHVDHPKFVQMLKELVEAKGNK